MILKNRYGHRVSISDKYANDLMQVMQSGDYRSLNMLVSKFADDFVPPDGPRGGQPDMYSKITSKYPALKSIGNVVIKPDTAFTRDKTGVGDIETFFPQYDEVNYNSGYSYKSPNPGGYGVVYNPETNDEQSIFLDLLHIMPEVDSNYSQYRNEFKQAMLNEYGGDLEGEWGDYQKQNPLNDGRERFTENWVDGHIRGLMFEGSPEDFKKHNYWEGARDLYLKSPAISGSFGKLKSYIGTGVVNDVQKPK